MGSTIHPSCTAGNGLAQEGFLIETSVEDQLCLASPSLCSVQHIVHVLLVVGQSS